MRSIRILEAKPEATEVELRQIEADLRLELPKNYREFVIIYNGGHPEECAFTYQIPTGGTGGSVVNRFLSFARGGGHDFVDFFRTYKSPGAERIASDLIPIASDPFGNLVCLSIQGPRCGQIFFWDHEDEDPANHSNEYYVSDSFESFLDSLGPLPDVEITEIPPDVQKALEEEE